MPPLVVGFPSISSRFCLQCSLYNAIYVNVVVFPEIVLSLITVVTLLFYYDWLE